MIILGGLLGFIYFLYELESPSMGNIIFRVDSNNNKIISFESIFNIIQAPFKNSYFWTNTELLSVNWIITTFIGASFGYIIKYYN
jgi:hypothetical protein